MDSSTSRIIRGTATSHGFDVEQTITAKVSEVITRLEVLKHAALESSGANEKSSGDGVSRSLKTIPNAPSHTAAPGACFMISGPSGSGKTTLVNSIIDSLTRGITTDCSVEKSRSDRGGKEAKENTIKRHSTSSPRIEKLLFGDAKYDGSAKTGPMHRPFSAVRITHRSVDCERALRHVYQDSSTMLHTEIFGSAAERRETILNRSNQTSSSSLENDIYIELTQQQQVHANHIEGNASSGACPVRCELHMNFVKWDNFDLFFGKDGGVPFALSRNGTLGSAGDNTTETTTEGNNGVAFIPAYANSTASGNDSEDLSSIGGEGLFSSNKARRGVATSSKTAAGEEENKKLGNITFVSESSSSSLSAGKSQSASLRSFASSPELLMHFMTLASRIGGKSLGFFTSEPRFTTKRKDSNIGLFPYQINENPSAPTTTSTPTVVINVTFLFAVANSDASLDPILLEGPSFDRMYELLTPTESERKAILTNKLMIGPSPHKEKGSLSSSSDLGKVGASRKEGLWPCIRDSMAEYVTSAAAAKLGGCSAEYVAFAAEYLAAKMGTISPALLEIETTTTIGNAPILINGSGVYEAISRKLAVALHEGFPSSSSLSAPSLTFPSPSLVKKNLDTPALSLFNLQISNDLAAFDSLWSGTLLSASSETTSSRRSQIGYTDVQKVLWTDIAGLSDVKKQLQRLVLSVKNKDAYLAKGVEPSIGAILYGPPGTGKTMLAKAMATEMLASFVYLDLPELINGAIGESEKVLKQFFSVAKDRSPCIMFIDEIQSAFSKRYDSSRGGNNSAHEARLVSALLSLLDEARQNFFSHPVVFIGATNWIDVIDEAVLRPGRLDTHIYVGPPQLEAREALVKHYVEQQWSAWVPSASSLLSLNSALPLLAANGQGEGLHAPPVVAEDSAPPASGASISASAMLDLFVAAFVAASEGLSGAELKNGLNEFAITLFIGDRFGMPRRLTSGGISSSPYEDFFALFSTSGVGEDGTSQIELRPEVKNGMKRCCRKL